MRVPVGSDRLLRMLRAASLAMLALVAVGALVTLGLGAGVSADVGCDVCHEMDSYMTAHSESDHAGVSCAECHASSGWSALVEDGLRAVGWIARKTAVETVSPSVAPNEPCVGCHAGMLDESVRSDSVIVRHSDFIEEPCVTCHGGRAHAVGGRHYMAIHMEDCMGCHRASVGELRTCEVCHPPDAPSERTPGWSAWRASHGKSWRQTHGMGDIDECRTCHAPQYCVSCHGVVLPHSEDWPAVHGSEALASGGVSACTESCHSPRWCTGCHGIEMPHAAAFLPAHGTEAERVGATVCVTCHARAACDECHLASSHPNVPDVGMSAHETGRSQ